jgi:hypothetical protein
MSTPAGRPGPSGLELLSRVLGDPELRRLAAELTVKKVRTDVQMLQNGAALSRRVLEMVLRPSTPGAGERVAEDVGRLVRANIEHYSALLDLQLAFSRSLLEPARPAAAAGSSPASASTPPTDSAVVHASARPGETIHVPFEVRSNRPHPLVVTFAVTPFVSDDRVSVVQPPVFFEPIEAVLGPEESTRVRLRILVTDGFLAGKTYTAAVLPIGIEDLRLTVHVAVLDPVPHTRDTAAAMGIDAPLLHRLVVVADEADVVTADVVTADAVVADVVVADVIVADVQEEHVVLALDEETRPSDPPATRRRRRA